MAKLVWAVPCQRIITDAETNSVSYVDALEGLAFRQLPAPIPPLMVGTFWVSEREDDEIEMRVVMVRPDGTEFHAQDSMKVKFAPAHTRYRINIGAFGGQASVEGEYGILVQQKHGRIWNTIQRLPLTVKLVPAGAATQSG